MVGWWLLSLGVWCKAFDTNYMYLYLYILWIFIRKIWKHFDSRLQSFPLLWVSLLVCSIRKQTSNLVVRIRRIRITYFISWSIQMIFDQYIELRWKSIATFPCQTYSPDKIKITAFNYVLKIYWFEYLGLGFFFFPIKMRKQSFSFMYLCIIKNLFKKCYNTHIQSSWAFKMPTL